MFDVLRMGLTFRDSLSSKMRKISSLDSEIVWIRNGPNLNRQFKNYALNEFMKTIQFSNIYTLQKLFSYGKFCFEDTNQNKSWSGVVMDRTTDGISGSNPMFPRLVEVVQTF